MKNSKALRAAHILKKYCRQRTCDDCIFLNSENYMHKCAFRMGYSLAEIDLNKADKIIYRQEIEKGVK